MSKLTTRQVALIRRTVAKECSNAEFEVFLDMARARGLDPLLGHIVPKVQGTADPTRRRLSFIISREGQRLIAQRCGDYRAATKPPRYHTASKKRAACNPDGIVSATVFLWKKDLGTGEWYEVAGQAYWDEFSPLTGAHDAGLAAAELSRASERPGGASGAWSPGADSWRRMPRLMIAKCAEMQALRAGWPDLFGGLYDEAEWAAAAPDDENGDPFDAHAAGQARVSGGRRLTVHWGQTALPELVDIGAFGQKAMSFVSTHQPEAVRDWASVNRDALREYWQAEPVQALMLKKLIEVKLGEGAATVH